MSHDPSPFNLLLVTPRYFPYTGGVEQHVYQVARRLADQGATVTVLSTDPSRSLPPEEQSEGVRILRVGAWPARSDLYVAPALYPTITRGSWDIIHVQSYHTFVAPLAMLAARHAHIPYVVTFHGGGHSSRLRNALRGPQRALLRPLLIRAARLVTVASFENDLFGRRLGIPANRFALIPNGSDLPAVAPGQASRQVPSEAAPGRTTRPGEIWIASVGRLERYKGHQRILAALPEILRQRPESRLSILGAGPYESTLRRMAAALGVTEQVEIRAIPPDDRRAMAAAMAGYALVVLLSEYETHPLAILEALALGRPALVADTSGLRELADRGWAHAIPLRSTPEQVAAAVLDQLDHPLTPVGVRLSTWDDCASALLTLYQDILCQSEDRQVIAPNRGHRSPIPEGR